MWIFCVHAYIYIYILFNSSFRLLALKWTSEIISSLNTSQHVYTTRQFLTLVQALYHLGYDQEEEVAAAVQSCLTSLFKNPKAYPKYIIKGYVLKLSEKFQSGVYWFSKRKKEALVHKDRKWVVTLHLWKNDQVWEDNMWSHLIGYQ